MAMDVPLRERRDDDRKPRTSPPMLAVPVGEPVRLILTSLDVNHAFYVPDFLLKRDVIDFGEGARAQRARVHRHRGGHVRRPMRRVLRHRPRRHAFRSRPCRAPSTTPTSRRWRPASHRPSGEGDCETTIQLAAVERCGSTPMRSRRRPGRSSASSSRTTTRSRTTSASTRSTSTATTWRPASRSPTSSRPWRPATTPSSAPSIPAMVGALTVGE